MIRRVAPVIVIIIAGFAFWFINRATDDPHSPRNEFLLKEQQARDHPDDFDAQLEWAEALVKAKQFDDAGPVLQQAGRLKPADARPFAMLGKLAVRAGQEDQARGLFHRALERDPSNIDALRGLANLDAKAHHLRAAIDGFQKIVDLQPNDADAWQGLGLLLITARENYRCLNALERAAAIAPNDAITERALGTVALNAGKLDQAYTAFQIVLKQNPKDARALTGLADVMMRRDPSPNGLAAAERQADAAIAADPTAAAYYLRGFIRLTERHLPEALQDLNTSRKLDPRHQQTYVVLSECYALAGKPDMAREVSARLERLRASMLARDRAALDTTGSGQSK